MLNVGIIGCGLIGRKRAAALGDHAKLVACADVNVERARTLADPHQALAFTSHIDVIKQPDLDMVIVATLHDSLAAIALDAVKSGKHVLIEKPAARTPAELEPLMQAATQRGVKVHVGFNHRYHRAMRKAKELVISGVLGDLMFIRGRYGHGGRPGYAKEWRANREISGGGELIDQGPHLIDLSRWFMQEEFSSVSGFAETYFWNMPVDDNAFMMLKSTGGKTAFLQVSCTEWKNMFSLEIYGKNGKLEISGLGGSYGTERLTWYRMLPEMGPPETSAWEYPMPDDSWEVELRQFFAEISAGEPVECGLEDAHASLSVIEQIYRNSHK
jgi:predicted dehydrogenase